MRSRLVAWLGEKPLSRVMFEDIKISWLEDFSDFLGMTERPNTVSIHLRNVRAVVNYAIDNEVTTLPPIINSRDYYEEDDI